MTVIHNWDGVRPDLRLVVNNSDAEADNKVRAVRSMHNDYMDGMPQRRPRVPRIPAKGPARIPVGSRMPVELTPRAWRLLVILGAVMLLAAAS